MTRSRLEELAPDVELIFVNTSGLPVHAPLFRGLPNPVRRADSVCGALELVCAPLGECRSTESR